jgi:hypothetical protein
MLVVQVISAMQALALRLMLAVMTARMAAMMAIAMESCRIRDRVEEWSPLLHL